MTAASLPSFADHEALRTFRAEPAQWLPIALDIAHSHGLAGTAPHVFSTGTNLVMALDEKLILKIFSPSLRSQFDSERGSLRSFADGQRAVKIFAP
jgi:hygromycin-B 7''-O-kinase